MKPKSNLTFNIALFAVAFFICLLVALLMVQGEGNHAPAPPGAGVPQGPGRVTGPGARQGVKTDAPAVLAYDPLARTPRVRVEADVGSGIQTTPIASAGPDELQIPNTEVAAPPPNTQAPADPAAYAAAPLAAGQPAALSSAGAGLAARGTPEMPEIAVPEGIATPRPTPSPTPVQRGRNIPRDLVQTPLPVQSNQTGNPLDNRVTPRSATDAGTYPRWGTSGLLPQVGPAPSMPGGTSELPVELPEAPTARSAPPSLLDARRSIPPTPFAAPSAAASLAVSTPALYAPEPSPADAPSSDFDISAALQSTPSVPASSPAMELPPIDPVPTAEPDDPRMKDSEPAAAPSPEPAYTPIPTPAVVTVRHGDTEVTFSNVKSPLRTTPPGGTAATPTTPESVRQAIADSLNQPRSATPAAASSSPTPRVQWVAPPPDAAGQPTSALPAPTPALSPGASFQPGAPSVLSNAAALPSPTPTGGETDPEAIAALARGGGKDGAMLNPEQIAKLPPDLQERVGALKRKSGAQVGDRVLTQDDIDKRLKAALIIKGGGDLDESERVKLEGYLTRDWVQKTAIATEARRQGVQVTDADIQKYRQKLAQRIGPNYEQMFRQAGLADAEIQREITDSTLVEKMVEIAYSKNVDDKKLREVYDASPDMFTPSRRLKVSEIYKAAPATGDATAAQKEIESLQQRAAGGEDFAQLARSASDAPSRERGGDIGWIDASTPIGPEMLETLSSLSQGQVSPVIKSASGWRVLKLEQVQEPKPGLEGAKENVETHLRKFLKDAAYRTAVEHTKVIIDGETQTADASGRARVRQPPGQGSATARRTAAAGTSSATPTGQATPAGFGPSLGNR